MAFNADALRISKATADGVSVEMSSGKDATIFNLQRALPKIGKAVLRFRMPIAPKGRDLGSVGSYCSLLAIASAPMQPSL